ncbi:hypothetical protein [Dysosmobacter welbionis]|uniref:hypothetical protein n=1 Tax=Dysosmobacter welbionis TaxID=2093857 RepID=UPI003A8FAD04
MRQISVLLTKYSDWISTLVYYIGGRGFTHSSIALEEDETTYYSFNYRGFAVETVEKHHRRGVKKSRCIRLRVSEEAYCRIRERIQNMAEHHTEYRYTRLGLLFCILRLPFHWKRHYFCSQFVAELLKESGAVPLKHRPGFYLPNQFAAELPGLPACQEVLCNVV